MSGARAARPQPLGSVLRLLDALEAAGIRYCHWKSTSTLAEALAGLTDLDLLIDRRQAPDFAATVGSLGFKRFISHPSRQLPGVEDWLGLDLPARRLVHLHVYAELVLGEELVKNHRLPVEDVLLDHTLMRDGIRVPRPELELAILTVRALLKYREDAFLRDLLPIGHRGGLPAGISGEVRELLGRTTIEAVSEAVDEHLPMLPSSLIAAFLRSVRDGRQDPRRIRAMRRELEHRLRPYRRRGELALLPLRARSGIARSRGARVWRHTLERVRGRPSGRRKVAATGGRGVAIIGIDGSGKSTVVRELLATFGWRVNVVSLYLGSARPGVIAASAQATARGGRRLSGWLDRRLGGDSRVARLAAGGTRVLTGIRAVTEARERLHRATLGRRLASEGWLVLYDRYPMPELRIEQRRMDAWRLTPRSDDGWLLRRLAARERAIYRGVLRPELIIALRLDADAARSRKAAAPAALDAKAGALAGLGEGGATIQVVDASEPLEAVLRQVTQAVWDRL